SGISFQWSGNIAQRRERVDAIDARNRREIWREEHLRTSAEHLRRGAIPAFSAGYVRWQCQPGAGRLQRGRKCGQEVRQRRSSIPGDDKLRSEDQASIPGPVLIVRVNESERGANGNNGRD